MSRSSYTLILEHSDGLGKTTRVAMGLGTHGDPWNLHARTDQVAHSIYQELHSLTEFKVREILEALKGAIPDPRRRAFNPLSIDDFSGRE